MPAVNGRAHSDSSAPEPRTAGLPIRTTERKQSREIFTYGARGWGFHLRATYILRPPVDGMMDVCRWGPSTPGTAQHGGSSALLLLRVAGFGGLGAGVAACLALPLGGIGTEYACEVVI